MSAVPRSWRALGLAPGERLEAHLGRAVVGKARFHHFENALAGLFERLHADAFFGLDCNGFVGTWLQMNGVPGVNKDSSGDQFFPAAMSVAGLGDIQAPMLIRFNVGERDWHVNVIDGPGPASNVWMVVGAEAGGIVRNPYHLTPLGGSPNRWRVRCDANGMACGSAPIGPCEPLLVQAAQRAAARSARRRSV